MVESKIVKKNTPMYPRLMQEMGNTEIVLFTSDGRGTAVHGTSIGDHCTNWDMTCFKDFTGTIELKN